MKQDIEHRSITASGQVYIPPSFLEQVGLEVGDTIQFFNHDDYISFKKNETESIPTTRGERAAKLMGTVGHRGRIVIPKRVRVSQKLQPYEKFEISAKDKCIVLRRVENQELEYKVIEETGRIYIPPFYLEKANLSVGDHVQFFNYDNYFLFKKAHISNFEDYASVTGEIRKIDEIGRVMIPKSIRDFHNVVGHEKFEIKLLDKCIAFRMFNKDNSDFDDEIINFNKNSTSTFHRTIKDGRLSLTLPVVHLLGFKPNAEVQFFIKDAISIVVREYKLMAAVSNNDLVYTGQSRKIKKDGALVIPKKIRDKLNIKDNDKINIKIEDNDVVLTKV